MQNFLEVCKHTVGYVKSPSLIGRDQQIDDSLLYVESFPYYVIPTVCRYYIIHEWLNIRQWVIHLLISTNQRRAFDLNYMLYNIIFVSIFFRNCFKGDIYLELLDFFGSIIWNFEKIPKFQKVGVGFVNIL